MNLSVASSIPLFKLLCCPSALLHCTIMLTLVCKRWHNLMLAATFVISWLFHLRLGYMLCRAAIRAQAHACAHTHVIMRPYTHTKTLSVVESDSEDDSSGEDGFDSDSNVRVIFKSDRNMRRSTQIASMSRQSVKLSPMPGSGGSSRLKQHRKSYSHAPSQPGNIHGRVSFSIRTGSRPGGGKRMLLTGMGDGKSKHGSDRGSSSKGGGGREMKRTGSIIQFNSQGSAINYPPLPVPGAPDTQISSSARADQNTAITSSHQKIKTNNNNNIKKDNYVDDGKGNREAKTAVVHSNTLTLDDENLPELGKDVEKGEEVKTRDDGVDDEVKAAQEIVKLFNDDELQCCCCACLKGKTPLRLLSWFCMFLFFLFGGVIMLDL